MDQQTRSISTSDGGARADLFRARGGEDQSARLNGQDLQVLRQVLDYNRDRLVEEIQRLERQPATDGHETNGGAAQQAVSEAAWSEVVAHRTIAEKRSILREIDEALQRMATSTYGRCVVDGRGISKSVLQELPWLKYCEHCAATGRTAALGPGIGIDS